MSITERHKSWCELPPAFVILRFDAAWPVNRRKVDIGRGAAGHVVGWQLTENGPKQAFSLLASTEMAAVI